MIQLLPASAGPVTQLYGTPQAFDGKPHAGEDRGYYGPNGEVFPDARAMDTGTVVFAGDSRELGWPNPYYLNPDFDRTDTRDDSAGNVVIIAHAYGFTIIAHLASVCVTRGQHVTAGQLVGEVGATGRATGRHTHAELLLFPLDFTTPTYGRSNPADYYHTPKGAKVTPAQMQEMKLFFQSCINDSIRKHWASEEVTQQLVQDLRAELAGERK